MNSSGIALLVTLLVRIKRQKQLLLVCELSPHYRHIFALTRLEEALSNFDSEPEAIAAAHGVTVAVLEQGCPSVTLRTPCMRSIAEGVVSRSVAQAWHLPGGEAG